MSAGESAREGVTERGGGLEEEEEEEERRRNCWREEGKVWNQLGD